MQSLSAEQKTKATMSNDKAGNNIQAQAYSDNKTFDFQGLAASAMTEAQKNNLLGLINQYISNMDEGHAHLLKHHQQK